MQEKYRIFYIPTGQSIEVRVKCFRENEEDKFIKWRQRLDLDGVLYVSYVSVYVPAYNRRDWYQMKEEYCNKAHIVKDWMEKEIPVVLERAVVTHLP